MSAVPSQIYAKRFFEFMQKSVIKSQSEYHHRGRVHEYDANNLGFITNRKTSVPDTDHLKIN
jgi:hypothetical protein